MKKLIQFSINTSCLLSPEEYSCMPTSFQKRRSCWIIKAPMKVETGTSEAVYNNQKESPLFSEPVFQITKLEKLENGPEEKPRFKVNLSDGTYYIKGIISSAYTNHFDRGSIKIFSLIKLGKFSVKSKNENYFVYVQTLKGFVGCDEKIGDPVNIATKRASITEASARNEVFVHKKEQDNPPTKKLKIEEKFNPIASINPFHNKWVIKGRVTLKSDVRSFTTQKGEGKVFSLEMADESAQIKIVAFNDIVDIFYPIFEVGKVYTVSKGSIKMANKQYSNNNMDYEIHLDKSTEVNQTMDGSEPKYFFNFTRISDLKVGSQLFDVIGVIKDVYPASKVTIKSTQKENTKRDMILVDESGSVRVTLWGSKASIEIENNPVMSIKSVRASEYNGVCLSTISSSQILINPDLERAFELRGWFDSIGKDLKITLPKKEEKISTIQEVKDNELEYSLIAGSFMYIKEGNLWYDSCVGESCNKKVTLEDNGRYRCEKCNKVYEECDQRYMMSVHVSDFTGQLWTSIFNEAGTELFGRTAKELKDLAEENSSQLQCIVKSLYFKEYKLKIKGRQDFYNNEPRMRYSTLSLEPINMLSEARRLINIIDAMMPSK